MTTGRLLLAAALLVGCLPACSDPGGDAAPARDATPPEDSSLTEKVPSSARTDDEPFAGDSAEATGLADAVGYGRGASIIDLDGDGWEDLFLADTDGRMRGGEFGTSRVYRNREGRFERWDIGLDPDDMFATSGGAFGDYDNDGLPDLLIVNGNNTARSRLALYENRLDTEGRFVDVTESSGIPTAVETWWGGAWFDADTDGFLDLIVTGSRTALLMNDGSGRFIEETRPRGLGAWLNDPVHKNPVVVDIDDDGAPDLASGGGSPAVLFRNDGDGNFTDVTDTALPSDLPPQWWVAGFTAATADFNQDGHEDLYFGRFWYQDYVLLNDGDGTFTAHSTDVGIMTKVYDESVPFFGGQPAAAGRSTSPTTPTTWQWTGDYTTGDLESENSMGLAVGDLNDDGSPDVAIGTGDPSRANLDIFFCAEAPGDGSVRFERCLLDVVADQGPTRGHGIALGDLDGNGSTDLLTNPGGWTEFDAERDDVDTRERPHLYLGRSDPDGAVVLRLLSHGRDAFGARVKVSTSVPRYHTVRSTHGFNSMNSPSVRFRIDEPTQVEVTWPGGRTSRHDVEPGDRLSFEDPSP